MALSVQEILNRIETQTRENCLSDLFDLYYRHKVTKEQANRILEKLDIACVICDVALEEIDHLVLWSVVSRGPAHMRCVSR